MKVLRMYQLSLDIQAHLVNPGFDMVYFFKEKIDVSLIPLKTFPKQ